MNIKPILTFIILFQCVFVNSQESSNINIKLLQGIQQDDFVFLDGEGYSILTFKQKKKYSPKTIKKLKKKFNIDKSNTGSQTEFIEPAHFTFEEQIKEKRETYFRKHIIFKLDQKHTKLIEISTSLERDTVFENKLIKAIINNTIPKQIFNNWEVDSIRFVNRHIQLGDACKWQNVGSIQCPYNGQMDWSVFSDIQRAEEYIRQRILITSDKKMSDFISQDSIIVDFENQETPALKKVLKIKTPKLLLGGSNELTIYYVIGTIEDVHVACVMSHYSNDNNAPGLPPLLGEVMKLKKE